MTDVPVQNVQMQYFSLQYATNPTRKQSHHGWYSIQTGVERGCKA